MAEVETPNLRKRGGWISFPFVTGATALLTLATAGWTANLIVYLTEKFSISSIDAAQIYNIVNGCINLLPVVAAIIADSFLGCFMVAAISSAISLLGIVLLSLTAIINSLRPQSCSGPSCLTETAAPSEAQLAVLYISLSLGSLGAAGTWFTLATIGANQFHKPDHQATFFNWYLFAKYVAFVIGTTVFVYVQDSVSWGLGFGLCAAANLVGMAVLVLGSRFYRLQKPEGSPFTGLVQVLVAAFKKRRLLLSSNPEDYYYYHGDGDKSTATTPRKSFRFFNRAALKLGGETTSDGASIAKPWSLCSVQQVEDLKTLIRVIPLWSSSLFLSTPIAVQNSVTVLQAIVMDRHLGSHGFTVPAGSVLVLVMISGCVAIAVIDRVLNPLWLKLTGSKSSMLRPFKRIGVGHVLNVLSMAVSALVESKRLHSTHMSFLWLFPQLILVGAGEAFHFPGQVAFYYQEFPVALKTSAISMVAMTIGAAFYLSTAVVDGARRLGWLKDDLNKGRLDIAYWMLAAGGAVNFLYYLICATLYTYQPLDVEEEKEEDDDRASKLSSIAK